MALLVCISSINDILAGATSSFDLRSGRFAGRSRDGQCRTALAHIRVIAAVAAVQQDGTDPFAATLCIIGLGICRKSAP